MVLYASLIKKRFRFDSWNSYVNINAVGDNFVGGNCVPSYPGQSWARQPKTTRTVTTVNEYDENGRVIKTTVSEVTETESYGYTYPYTYSSGSLGSSDTYTVTN